MIISKKIFNSKYTLAALGILSTLLYLAIYRLQLGNDCGLFYIRKTYCEENFSWYIILVTFLILLSLVYVLAAKINLKKHLKLIIIFSIIFHTIMLFTWPLTSTDIYNYINQGRLVTEYHVNPYDTSYSDVTNDPLYPWLNNKNSNVSSIYGPLNIYLSIIINFFARNNFFLLVFIFKLLFVIVNLLNIYLLHTIFKRPIITFLYAWNPLVLFEIANNSHNDVLIIFFLLLAIKLIKKDNIAITIYIQAGIFLLLATLVKLLTIFFLPLFYFYALFRLPKRKQKLMFGIIMPVLCILIASALYFPFAKDYNIFSTVLLTNQINNNIYGHSTFIQFSEIIIYNFDSANYLHLGAYLSRSIFIFIIAAIIYCLYIFRKRLTPLHLINVFYFSFAAFIIFALTWLMPWYLLVLILLAIMVYSQTNKKIVLYSSYLFLFYAIIFYIFLR